MVAAHVKAEEKTFFKIIKDNPKFEDEVLESYRKKLSEFTALDLDKELAYELKKTNPSVFTKTPGAGYVPKDDPKGGIDEILLKYKK